MTGKPGDRSTHDRHDLGAVLAARHDSLRTHLVAARRGTEDGVHRARVATRRLREIVPVVASGLPGVRRRRLQRGLRALTRALGEVRECDVTLGLLGSVEGASAPELAGVVRKGRQALRARRSAARAALGEIGKAADVRKVDTRLQRLLLARRDSRDQSWRELLAQQLDTRARRLRTRLEHAGVVYASDSLHEVRIAGKKLRYALELVNETDLAPVARLVRQLSQVQDVLGHLHDLDVLVGHLRATVAGEPETSSGARAIEQLDNSLERQRRTLHATYLRRRAALIRLADVVRDEVVPPVRGDLDGASGDAVHGL